MNKDVQMLVSTIGTNKMWDALQGFSEISHTLNLSATDIAHLIESFEEVKDMGALPEMRKAISKWAEHNQDSAMSVFANLLKLDNAQLYSVAPLIFKVLSATPYRPKIFMEVLALLNSISSSAMSAGIRAVSLVPSWNPELKYDLKVLQASEELFRQLIEDVANHGLFADVSNCCFSLYPYFENPDQLLLKLAEFNDPQIQYSIARGLWVSIKFEEHPTLCEALVLSLSSVDDSKKELISQIDRTLHHLSTVNVEVIIKYFNKWIQERALNEIFHIKEFSRTFEKVITLSNKAFETWITQSLLSKESKFHVAVAEVLSAIQIPSGREIQFDGEIISKVNLEDIQYITFKTLGWINSKKYWRSLILSLLIQKIEDKKTLAFLSSIFQEPILYHYPSTKKYLQSKQVLVSTSVAKALRSIIKKSDAYFEAIQKLERRQEFAPSEQRLLAYHKLEHKKFTEGIRKHQGDDHFMNTVKTIDLKGGKTWFCKINGTYTKKSELNTIEHSREMARSGVINPIGWARLQYEFRRG